MTTAEVKERLGKPSSETSKGGSLFWTYDAMGLELRFIQDQLAYVEQTAGRITDHFGIGDGEAYLSTVAASVENGANGIKTFTLIQGDFVYTVTTKNGKIIGSQFSTADVP
jgi:hypothetical protein